MKILEKIRKIRKIIMEDTPEQLAQGVVDTYLEKKENGEQNPVDDTVKKALDIIEETNDLNKVKDFLRSLAEKSIEEKDVSEKILTKTSIAVSKKDNIPNNVIAEAVQEADIEVPDKVIDTIIEEGDINHFKERIKLIQNVDNKKIIVKRVKDELKMVYNGCDNKQDWEIASIVTEILGLLKEEDRTTEIQELVHRIVGRKMAENYYDDKRRGTRIYELSKIMSYEEMMEKDLPEIVQREYRILEEEAGEKEDRFSKTDLTKLILDKMADNIAIKYKETGIFAIPQSNNMKNLTPEEEKRFIKTIQSFSREEITEDEIKDIREQIRGKVTNKQTREDILINFIKKLPNENKSENIDLLIKLVEGDKTLEMIAMLESSNVLERLEAIPEEKRKQSIESIGEVLEKRKFITQTVKFGQNNEKEIDVYIKE